jgi:hypothetical protein
VVEVDDVDRLDGGVGVRVRGEQGPPRVREQVHRLLEELEPGHVGHAMVRQHHGHEVTAQLELPQRLQRLRTGLRPHHPVGLAVLAAEVPGDGARHAGIVVDRQQDGLTICLDGHGAIDGIGVPARLFTRYRIGRRAISPERAWGPIGSG